MANSLFGVPILLAFTGTPGVFKIGRGEAGWTVVYFEDYAEALVYAGKLPEESRVPNHGITRS